MLINSFSPEVQKEIQYYVYRLIDPRNGNTFYVGKGSGDRLFQHVKGALKFSDSDGEEDAERAKIKTIKEIHEAGLEVIHVIHRHGMSEATAFEVEAALIDAIPGLTNVILGNGSSDRGPMHASQIEAAYGCQPINNGIPSYCMIIKIRKDVVDEKGVYNAIRSSWRVGENGRKNTKYVLAVIDGVVREVFQNLEWKKSEDTEGRWEFSAETANQGIASQYVGKRLPAVYSQPHAQNPIQYGKD